MFQNDVNPVWEDPAHVVGGAWTFRAKHGHANQLWENLLLGLIGEQFELPYEVTGIFVRVSADVDKFQVWFRHGKDEEVKAQVRKDFLRILELPPETSVTFTGFSQFHPSSAQKEGVDKAQQKDKTARDARELKPYRPQAKPQGQQRPLQ